MGFERNRDFSPTGVLSTTRLDSRNATSARPTPFQVPHVYPLVRIDTPIDQTDPTQKITVVKVLTSQSDAEAEVSRLSHVNADKSCLYFYCTSRLIEQGQ
jgi:hypothetical protein